MPSMRGIEKPQMSASSTPTVNPWAAIAAARLTVTDDLPTPPLPDATASTRVVAGIWVSGACSRAFHRAWVITSRRSSASISPHSMRHLGDPRVGADAGLDVLLDLGAQRAAADRQLDPDRARARLGDTVTPLTMPKVTMSAPSSGSMTPRSSPVTASAVGGANCLDGHDVILTEYPV